MTLNWDATIRFAIALITIPQQWELRPRSLFLCRQSTIYLNTLIWWTREGLNFLVYNCKKAYSLLEHNVLWNTVHLLSNAYQYMALRKQCEFKNHWSKHLPFADTSSVKHNFAVNNGTKWGEELSQLSVRWLSTNMHNQQIIWLIIILSRFSIIKWNIKCEHVTFILHGPTVWLPNKPKADSMQRKFMQTNIFTDSANKYPVGNGRSWSWQYWRNSNHRHYSRSNQQTLNKKRKIMLYLWHNTNVKNTTYTCNTFITQIYP